MAENAVRHIQEYIDQADWRVNENANGGYSIGGLIMNVAGWGAAEYWLRNVYSEEIAKANREGALHIHDLNFLGGYCCGHSLRDLLEQGLGGVPNQIDCAPPEHFRSAIDQAVNYLGVMSNSFAGAQAFASVDTYLAAFIRKDGLGYNEVKQCLQSFVYALNIPSRWSGQAPFTNITMDLACPDDLKGVHPKIGGVEQDFTYGDLQAEMDMFNIALCQVYLEGDAKGRPFTFPIPTYTVTEEFPWGTEVVRAITDMTAKYGLPYFSLFINSDMDPSDVRSMCCRLRLDLRELERRGGALFGSDEKTGSIGVITINLARLGYLHKGDSEGLYAELDSLLEMSRDALEAKRVQLNEWLARGLYPYVTRYLGSWGTLFSTIGVNGANEMIRNFTGDNDDITTEFGEEMAVNILNHIRERLSDFQEETGNLYNLEASPAEGATYRFAKEDRKRYAGIIQAGTPDHPYYTNSTQLPVGYTEDPFEALAKQDELQSLYTGGTVLHLYMNERLSSGAVVEKMLRRTAETFRLPYISFTPTYSVCAEHGYLSGEHFHCPQCGAACEVWTRIMGYYRPVSQFNVGKKGEYHERRFFTEGYN